MSNVGLMGHTFLVQIEESQIELSKAQDSCRKCTYLWAHLFTCIKEKVGAGRASNTQVGQHVVQGAEM